MYTSYNFLLIIHIKHIEKESEREILAQTPNTAALKLNTE